MGEETKLVKTFDRNGDGRLDDAERKAARDFLAKERAEGRGPRRPGPRGRPADAKPPEAGPKLAPTDVKAYPEAKLYDPTVVRTLFLDFASADWEGELADFYRSDVEVPARLTVDGKTYADVGVHFRGASSFFTVAEGRKRSLNLVLDFAHKDQALGGYRTLNLLNSHTDPTFLRSVLYYQVARDYLPAPKANFVRVVLQGESWGAYINAQQCNKEFIQEWFGTTQGARWKVPGSPRGRGGLNYLGPEAANYQGIYSLKTKEDPKSWNALIELCRVLNQAPLERLEAELRPILDLDGVLKFLALENALINDDGYWIRSSDYHLYLDPKGRMHLIPHDANETFRLPEGPGFGGGPAVDGVKLDPFVGSDNPERPLLSRLLAVPSLRGRYAGYVRDIAERWLSWEKLGPIIAPYQTLIAADVARDTHRLDSLEAFTKGVTEDIEEQGFRGPRRSISLKNFVEQRRAYLLGHPEIKIAKLPER